MAKKRTLQVEHVVEPGDDFYGFVAVGNSPALREALEELERPEPQSWEHDRIEYRGKCVAFVYDHIGQALATPNGKKLERALSKLAV